jgi:hypothetical protein
MREGKNDEMPCGNTIAEREYDGGGSYTPEEEEVIEGSYGIMKLAMTELKLRDADIFWEAIGPDGAKNAETAAQLTELLMVGTEKSLLAFGEIMRKQVYDYAEKIVCDDAWDEAIKDAITLKTRGIPF